MWRAKGEKGMNISARTKSGNELIMRALHTAAEAAVRSAVKILVSQRNDTIKAFFFAANKNKNKVKDDHRSKFSNLSNWKEEAWKKSGLQRNSNPWPPRYRCDALPTELWSHTLGARSIYRVHIFPCSEVMWSLYEIIHICTAVVDESEGWSSL